MAKKSKEKRPAKLSGLIRHHLIDVTRSLLQDERRPLFHQFLNALEKRGVQRYGVYALYNKQGRLIYVGRASDLKIRLSRHHDNWDKNHDWSKLSLFIFHANKNIHEIEAILITVANTPMNQRRGRLLGDLRTELTKYGVNKLTKDWKAAIYPDSKVSRAVVRETQKRLSSSVMRKYL